MNKLLVIVLSGILSTQTGYAQQTHFPVTQQFLDVSGAIGQREGTGAVSYVFNLGTGKKRKLDLGLGLRLTTYSGHEKEFYTAPGKYARSTTIPFAIVFARHLENNVDTLTLAEPLTAALNLSLNAGYHLGQKWYLGANIDLIGITAGRKTHGVLKSNGMELKEPDAKPTTFNLLLTGDNDFGSLNSEFFVRYNVAARWDIKLLYQFAFSEYKTETIHQTFPDGNTVYRFRNKANLFGAGLAHTL